MKEKTYKELLFEAMYELGENPTEEKLLQLKKELDEKMGSDNFIQKVFEAFPTVYPFVPAMDDLAKRLNINEPEQ